MVPFLGTIWNQLLSFDLHESLRPAGNLCTTTVMDKSPCSIIFSVALVCDLDK
jgi:hypothetical protein